MRNKKYYIIIWSLFLILLIVFLLFCSQKKMSGPVVAFENFKFFVEVADDDNERKTGLMYRDSLWEKSGMIFVFPDVGIHTFWMKNTLIPLDMIWIIGSGDYYQVVDIKTAAPCIQDPCETYVPIWIANYVMEINAWLADKYDIKVWDTLYVDITK